MIRNREQNHAGVPIEILTLSGSKPAGPGNFLSLLALKGPGDGLLHVRSFSLLALGVHTSINSNQLSVVLLGYVTYNNKKIVTKNVILQITGYSSHLNNN